MENIRIIKEDYQHIGSHLYLAEMDQNFGESEFDHLVLLQIPGLSTDKIPYRKSEIQNLHSVHIDDVQNLFQENFEKVLNNYSPAKEKFKNNNYEEVLGNISKSVDLLGNRKTQ